MPAVFAFLCLVMLSFSMSLFPAEAQTTAKPIGAYGQLAAPKPKAEPTPAMKVRPGFGAGTTRGVLTQTVAQFQCTATHCTCSGDRDCNDMFSTNVCGKPALCDNTSNSCSCLRAAH
jgi:hypothetical protein